MERAVKEDVRHVIEQAPLRAVGPYAAPLLIRARLAVESGFSVPRVGGQVICAVEPELGDYAALALVESAASEIGGEFPIYGPQLTGNIRIGSNPTPTSYVVVRPGLGFGMGDSVR